MKTQKSTLPPHIRAAVSHSLIILKELTGVTKEKCRDFVLIMSLNWEGRSDEMLIGRAGGRRRGMVWQSGLYYNAVLHGLAYGFEDKKTWTVQPTFS
jgi:hypothetical protein